MKVFIDTNIPMYAAGGDHSYQKSCQEIIISIAKGELDAYTDAEVLQEILYRFHQIRRKEAGFRLFDSFFKIMHNYILPVTAPDMLLARQLAKKYIETNLSPRDLIHLSVMLNNGINQIITTDQDFRAVRGIMVTHPY